MRAVLRGSDRVTMGRFLDSRRQAVDLEKQIGARAAEVEQGLMADAATLRAAMAGAKPYARRQLEARYAHDQHRLAMMRRAQALSRHTGERMSPATGGKQT